MSEISRLLNDQKVLIKRSNKFNEAHQKRKGTPLWIIKQEKDYLLKEAEAIKQALHKAGYKPQTQNK